MFTVSTTFAEPRNAVKELPPRPKLQAFQPGRDIESDLTLQAQRLQRDRIVRAAHQHIATNPDPERRAAICADIVAREIAEPELHDRRVDAPGQRRFLGEADTGPPLPRGPGIAVLRPALGSQHATEVGDRANDEADAGAASAFEDADLHAR